MSEWLVMLDALDVALCDVKSTKIKPKENNIY